MINKLFWMLFCNKHQYEESMFIESMGGISGYRCKRCGHWVRRLPSLKN